MVRYVTSHIKCNAELGTPVPIKSTAFSGQEASSHVLPRLQLDQLHSAQLFISTDSNI